MEATRARADRRAPGPGHRPRAVFTTRADDFCPTCTPPYGRGHVDAEHSRSATQTKNSPASGRGRSPSTPNGRMPRWLRWRASAWFQSCGRSGTPRWGHGTCASGGRAKAQPFGHLPPPRRIFRTPSLPRITSSPSWVRRRSATRSPRRLRGCDADPHHHPPDRPRGPRVRHPFRAPRVVVSYRGVVIDQTAVVAAIDAAADALPKGIDAAPCLARIRVSIYRDDLPEDAAARS